MKIQKLLIVLCLFSLINFAASPPAFSDTNGERVSFNFVDVEIPTVIKFISDLTGNNFLFDERIKGKITIIAPTKLSLDESFSLFTSVLSLKGYTIIPAGSRTYKIIPSSLAKQEGLISEDGKKPVDEAYITKLIPTEHIKADETIKFLRPIISRDGHISSFGPGNLLLVVDSAVNIEKVMSILKIIDKPSAEYEEAKINVYFVENADATNLATVLQGIMKEMQTTYKAARQGQKAGATESMPTFSITPDKSTNSLIIVAPSAEYQNILEVIKTLDKRRKQVFVEAMIIEAQIDNLKELGTRWRTMIQNENEPVAIGGFGNISSASMLSILSGLSGFSAGGMGEFLDVPISTVSSSGTVTTQTLTVPGFAALFSLSEFSNAINVLSTPQILTSDNEEAEIVVGENVPFISKRERDVTTTGTVLSSIERKDVGITLRITPQVTVGDHVKLNIYQEISALKETPESVFTEVGPTTTKRSTKTSVIVKDSHTVVIGGLMEEREEKEVSKMPLLGDIPVLGWLFKARSTSKKKTNLLVFLSPHIVKESPQLAKIAEEKHSEFVKEEKFYKKDELIVKFRDDVSADKAQEIISQEKASVLNYSGDTNEYNIKLKSGREVEDAARQFTSIPDVLYAEPNYRFRLHRQKPSPEQNADMQESAPAGSTGGIPGTAEEEIKRAMQKEASDIADVKALPHLSVKTSETPVEFSGDADGSAGELLLKFKDSISPEKAQEIIARHNASIVKYFKGINVYYIRLGPGQKVDDAIQEFTSRPDVLYAEPNSRVKTQGKDPGSFNDTAGQENPPFPVKDEAESSSPEESGSPETMTAGSPEPPTEPDDEGVAVPDVSTAATDTPDLKDYYYIQVGSWKHPETAQETVEKLKIHYPDAYVIEQNNFSKVRIPGITNRQQGDLILKDLKEKYNLDPLLVIRTKEDMF